MPERLARRSSPKAPALKLTVDIDADAYTLELERRSATAQYTLTGAEHASGSAQIAQLVPGVYSILLGARSFEVRVVAGNEELEVYVAGRRHHVSITDTRDRSRRDKKTGTHGPVEIRSQMPGKIIKLLVEPGAAVHTGQGVIVVEAMKMQNEMKSPKDGTVTKLHVTEGATVGAGEALLLIE